MLSCHDNLSEMQTLTGMADLQNVVKRTAINLHKCDLELNPISFQLSIKVFLVDSQSGESLIGDTNLSSSALPVFQGRSNTPFWDETIITNLKFSDIVEKKSTKILLLFEVVDVVLQPSTLPKNSGSDSIAMRVAWAFLKPVGMSGNLNVNKEVRLQLYKVRKNCSIPHQTCPVFHLYSAHEKKKYPGSLYVTIEGLQPPESIQERPVSSKVPLSFPSKAPTTSENKDPLASAAPNLDVSKWSRLPTQSCKIPNSTLASYPINRRGVSCVAFNHSGFFLACASFAQVIIIEVVSGNIVSKLAGHNGLVYDLDWYFDDSLLLTVSADCSAVIWNMKPMSKSPLHVLPHPSFLYSGKWIRKSCKLITGGKDTLIRFWVKTAKGVELIQEMKGHEGFVSAMETSGDLLITGDSMGCIRLWNLESKKWEFIRKLFTKEISGSVIDRIQLHPGQRRLLVTARTRGSFMIDVASGVIVRSYQDSYVSARTLTCLSPCGSYLYSYGSKNHVFVWEFDTGKIVGTYRHLFPDLGYSSSELSGALAYHPHEHIAAFAVLGFNYPLIILKYDRDKDCSDKLGLVLNNHKTSSNSIAKTIEQKKTNENSTTTNKPILSRNGSTEEKLAAIVRNIDKVLSAKKQMVGTLSRNSTPRS